MRLYPLIERELRVASRQGGTYWLRLVGAGAAWALVAFLLLGSVGQRRGGPELFADLNHALLLAIWVLVPVLTADCISREKREQTLGLLFLTPLRAESVMLAKVLAQGVRAAAIFVALVPVLAVPLLLGGVPAVTLWTALTTAVGTFCWALAAGALASVLSRTLLGALTWAFQFALLFLVVHATCLGAGLYLAVAGWTRWPPSAEWLTGMGLLLIWKPEHVLDGTLRMVPPSAHAAWQWACAGGVAVAGLGLGLVWRIGAWRLRAAWKESPPSARRQRVTTALVRPRVAAGRFRRLLRWQLERNPIGWLEQRRWTSRAAVAGWIGALALAQGVSLGAAQHPTDFRVVNYWLIGGLMGAMAMVAVASFRRERETGVLELLLTTPLSPQSIVAGRFHGIWWQFAPALALFAGVAAYAEAQFDYSWWRRGPTELVTELMLVLVGSVAVPAAGLWWSLRAKSHGGGLLLCLACVVLGPVVGAIGVEWIFEVGVLPLFVVALVTALVFGGWGVWQLARVSVAGAGLLVVGLGVLLDCAVHETVDEIVARQWSSVHALVMAALMAGVAGWAIRTLQREMHVRGASVAARALT